MATTTLGVSPGRLIEGYTLTLRSKGKSPKTVQFHAGNLRRFLWYARQKGWGEDIREIDEWRVREFLAYVAEAEHRWGLVGNGARSSTAQASHATVWHYFVTLRVFFTWLVREGFLAKAPTSGLKLRRPSPPVMEPYTPEQIAAMFRVCDWDYEHGAKLLGSRNKAILLILLDTGVRLSELCYIRVQDLDRDTGLVKVVGKGRRERMVRIGLVARRGVWRYLLHRPDNEQPWLFLTEEGKGPLSPNAVQCMVKRVKERAGLKVDGLVHKFRHTFSLAFLRADRNTFNLQYLLGHATLEMTKRYCAALGVQDALEAHVKASPVDNLGIKA